MLSKIYRFLDVCVTRLEAYFREPVNSLTHWAGAAASIVGLFALVYFGEFENDWALPSFIIFGLSMILLYSSSGLYHMVKASERVIEGFRRFDHMMIFVLIAGSYTPVALLVLDQPFGFTIFIGVWVVAALGILKKIFWMHAPRWVSTALYLAMGWAAVPLFPAIYAKLAFSGVFWMGLGGLFYTVGAIIYAVEKPDPCPRVLGHHEIWHLFVLSASVCHFVMVYGFIAPIS